MINGNPPHAGAEAPWFCRQQAGLPPNQPHNPGTPIFLKKQAG